MKHWNSAFSRFVAVGIGALALPSLSFAEPSPSDVQQMQQHRYPADKTAVFGAVVDVLQNLGFTIDNADAQTGFVTAESGTVRKSNVFDILGGTQESGNNKTTAFIEAMPGGVTRVRLNFLDIKTSGIGTHQNQPIYDVRIYQRAFSRIDNAVLERTGRSAGHRNVTPIGVLGLAQTGSSLKSKADLLVAAKTALTSEGFEIVEDDAGGELATAPLGVHLTVDQADCGKMLGISYLRDKRASTDVQYFVTVRDGAVTVRTAIDGLYRTGYGNADKPLTCTSRGVIEATFLARTIPNGQ